MYSKDSGNKRRVYIQDSGDKVALDVVDMSQEEEEIFLSACQQTVPSKEALVGKAVRGDRKVRIEIGTEKDKMFATVAPLILDHRSKQIQDPSRKRIKAFKRGQENAARVHELLDELGQSALDKKKGASQKKPHKRRGQQQTP